MSMLHNFRFILRRLSRQKFNTTLHIVGLTLGMSVCLLIALILRYEWSFDTWHKKADRIYRVNSVWTNPGKKIYDYSTPMPLAEALRSTVPGLEKVALAHAVWNNMVEINSQKRFKQEHILVTGPEILDVFDFPVLRGNGSDALKKPYQALLTQTTAKKFFGTENPIGKVFTYKNLINGNNSEFRITVAGLIQDLPSNTHLPASMLLSYVPDQNFLSANPDSWTDNSNTSTYVLLPPKFNQKNFEAQLKKLADKNINTGKGFSQHDRADFNIQPLRTIHFDTKYAAGSAWVKAVDPSWLWFFACIGVAVLLLACINFINLSTAQALTRAKEVGVRKTVGAGKFHLITQFLGEAWIIALIAGILSIVITKASVPAINNLLDKQIFFHPFQSPGLFAVFLPAILFTGLLAGLYPAWIIAKFNPVTILKTGSITTGAQGSSWLRKALVVTQFTISAGLLITLLLIAQQVNYMRYHNPGFNKDNILNVEISDSHKATAFSSELSKIPQVVDFSFATATPSNNGHWGSDMSATNENGPDRQPVTLLMGDHHFSSMYGLRLLSGRFPEAADTNYVSTSVPVKKQIIKAVVNEKLLKVLGLGSPEAAIGKRFWVGMNSGNVEIIGVVADFNLYSLHYAIPPTLISQLAQVYNQAGIKIAAGSNLPRTVAAIERAWKKTFPDGVFTFQLLDEQIDAYYKSEIRLYSLFKIFAGLAMFISCLGLWGLTAFAAQQRTKEVGIRKVLGASVTNIVTLFSKDFLKLVGLALVIASPISWYFMQQWLQDFAFRIDISGWIFIIAGIIVLVTALTTIGYLAIKAAMANPVKSLRTE